MTEKTHHARRAMNSASITQGINLRRALRIATDAGCQVRHLDRTGEIVVSHPGLRGRVRHSAGRKSASRHLVLLLRRALAHRREENR